jgi:hypothetical protein
MLRATSNIRGLLPGTTLKQSMLRPACCEPGSKCCVRVISNFRRPPPWHNTQATHVATYSYQCCVRHATSGTRLISGHKPRDDANRRGWKGGADPAVKAAVADAGRSGGCGGTRCWGNDSPGTPILVLRFRYLYPQGAWAKMPSTL